MFFCSIPVKLSSPTPKISSEEKMSNQFLKKTFGRVGKTVTKLLRRARGTSLHLPVPPKQGYRQTGLRICKLWEGGKRMLKYFVIPLA